MVKLVAYSSNWISGAGLSSATRSHTRHLVKGLGLAIFWVATCTGGIWILKQLNFCAQKMWVTLLEWFLMHDINIYPDYIPTSKCDHGLCAGAGVEESSGNFLQPMPWIMEMSVNPNRDLRDRSCEPCDDLNHLGAMCCGMCAFWVRACARHGGTCMLFTHIACRPLAVPNYPLLSRNRYFFFIFPAALSCHVFWCRRMAGVSRPWRRGSGMGPAMSGWWRSCCRNSQDGEWIWRASSPRTCLTPLGAAPSGVPPPAIWFHDTDSTPPLTLQCYDRAPLQWLSDCSAES